MNVNTIMSMFCAGLLTSIGPCAAPRMLAFFTLPLQRGSQCIAYCLGAVGGYASLALGLHVFQQVVSSNDMILRLVAIAFVASGLWGLLQEVPHVCPQEQQNVAAAFAFGFTTALVISPCCSPVFILLASTSNFHGMYETVAALAAFCIGQYLPIALLFQIRVPRTVTLDQSAMYVFRSIMTVALGGYYALLAV